MMRALHTTGRWLGLFTLLALLLAPAPALADAPGTRGPDSLGRGSVGSTPAASVWRDVRELPPPAVAARNDGRGPVAGYAGVPIFAPASAPTLQAGGAGNGAQAWLDRTLNPGNWILDAGMGIFAGIVKMFGGIAQKAALSFLGTASVLPAGCDGAATNFVFCTPASLTYDHPGVHAVWAVLRTIASSLVTLLFTVRLGRMIVEGPRSLATEGKGLVLTFLCSLSFIQATGPVCQWMVEFFNGISHLLLARASLAFPSHDVGDLNIGSNVLFLVLWCLILILVLKSFARIAQVIVLIAMAPLAGALLMDRSTSGRFRSWFEKLVELLLAQVNLAIIFVVITAILQPYQGRGAADGFVGLLLSTVMMGMALSGKSVIGIAGASIGGGGGIVAFLQYQVVGRALRSVARGGVGGGRGGDGGIAPRATHGAGEPPRAAQQRRDQHAHGDPSHSAAAQRQRAGSHGGAAALAAGEAFRRADMGAGFTSERLQARYGAAAAPAGASAPGATGARREQARLRATMMRQRASALSAAGDTAQADTLRRKARAHDAFGRAHDIARPSRFTDDERAQRRSAYHAALAEAGGMHGLERDALSERIRQGEERLPALERELALAGATGGGTHALHAEARELSARLAADRARLAAISPGEGGSPSVATRRAAAALANERLPERLRSRDYATRAGAASANSRLVKAALKAPTQAGRDELARARAHAVRVAQTPPDARPPIAPARRKHSGAGERKAGSAANAPGAGAKGSGPAARDTPSRAPSTTIARLRARRALPRQDAERDTSLSELRPAADAVRQSQAAQLPEDSAASDDHA